MASNNDAHAAAPPPPANHPQPAPHAGHARGPGKGQAMMKLILVFFISLFSFAVGTYVGKTYSDQQHKTAKLEPKNHLASVAKNNQHGEDKHGAATHGDDQHGDTAAAHGEGSHGETRGVASAHGQEMMTDDEIARLAAEIVPDDEPPAKDPHGKEDKHAKAGAHDAHGAAAAEDKNGGGHEAHHDAHGDQHAAPVAKSSGHGAPEKKPILLEDNDSKHDRKPASPDKKKPTEAMHEQLEKNTKPHANHQGQGRKPSSLPPNPIQDSIGKYTVQIASFATENEAKQRAAQLRTQGYNAFYVQANIKGNIWFRVSIGLFNTERDAKNYLVDYRKGNSSIQAIVQKISAE